MEKYLLENKRFELAEKLSHGDIQSQVIAGFSIPVKAIFNKSAFNKALAAVSGT